MEQRHILLFFGPDGGSNCNPTSNPLCPQKTLPTPPAPPERLSLRCCAALKKPREPKLSPSCLVTVAHHPTIASPSSRGKPSVNRQCHARQPSGVPAREKDGAARDVFRLPDGAPGRAGHHHRARRFVCAHCFRHGGSDDLCGMRVRGGFGRVCVREIEFW